MLVISKRYLAGGLPPNILGRVAFNDSIFRRTRGITGFGNTNGEPAGHPILVAFGNCE